VEEEIKQSETADNLCLFKTVTPFTEKENMDFQLYHARKITLFIDIMFPIAFILLGLIFILDKDYILGGTFCACGVIMPFVWNAVFRSTLRKNKQAFMGGKTSNGADFYADYFTEKTFRGEEQIGAMNIKYSDVVKVVDYKEYFFVYISKIQAVIITKSGFIVGDADKFLDFIALKNIKIIGKKKAA